MTIFQLACITFTLFLVSTVNSDKSIDDDKQTCSDLCESCDGIGSYIDGGCECHIGSNDPKTAECFEEIKKKAAEHNLAMVNMKPEILERATRCCPNTGRLRLSDILRVAKYFSDDGPRVGTRILGNHRNLEESIIDSADCQRCLDDEEDPTVEIGMPEEEAVGSFLATPPPSMQYIVGPQTCSVQNSYPYNNYYTPNTPSFDQIQSPHNYYRSLVIPPSSLRDYSRDQLSPLLTSPYPITHVTPLTAQVHPSHHQHHFHHEFIEPSLTHLPTLNHPQYSLMRVPHHSFAKSRMSGTYRNSIRNPSYLYPSVSQLPSSGARAHQTYRPRTSDWMRPIVQPFHTLPSSTISPIGYLPQENNLAWWYALPNTNMHNGMNQQFMPRGRFTTSTGNNYPAEPLLGAANPNADESNNNNNNNNQERSMSNMNGQQITTENYNENQSPMSSIRSDIIMQPEQSTSPSQTPMTSTLDNTLLINIPNTMKRTVPASLRYKQMNKRELKNKAP